MPENIQYEDDDLFNPETAHEHSDVPVRPLFWFIVIFIVFAIASHVVLYLLFKGFANAERRRMEAPQTQVARPADADVPRNQPLLQPFPHKDAAPQRNTPVTDLADMRKHEAEVLDHYGWVDKQKGVVHIPIEEAKKRFASQMVAQGTTAPTVPVTAPGAPAIPVRAPAGKVVPAATGTVPPPAATPAARPQPGVQR